jgi:high-affinity iron transporter
MLGQYLIAFREVLEAALIIGIMHAYLIRTNRANQSKYLWYGVYLALASSVALGLAIWVFYGGLADSSMKLFEGIAALIAVAVLTSMILWMATSARKIEEEIKSKVDSAVRKGAGLSLIAVAFILVFREGLETVLFLTPFGVTDPSGTVLGAMTGIISAGLIAFLIFRTGKQIELRKLFYYSSILLILLAAGLAGYGVHELIEYGEETGAEMGWMEISAYDIGLEAGSPLHHKGVIGSVFAVMFGYSTSMEVARVLVHVGYLAVFLPLTITAYKHPDKFTSLSRMLPKGISKKSDVKSMD